MRELFTPDELRVVLQWAEKLADTTPTKDMPGSDTLLHGELMSLKTKIRGTTPSLLLGCLNMGLLMGFDIFNEEFPLQEIWEDLKIEQSADSEDSLHKFTTFLEKASLIRRTRTIVRDTL